MHTCFLMRPAQGPPLSVFAIANLRNRITRRKTCSLWRARLFLHTEWYHRPDCFLIFFLPRRVCASKTLQLERHVFVLQYLSFASLTFTARRSREGSNAHPVVLQLLYFDMFIFFLHLLWMATVFFCVETTNNDNRLVRQPVFVGRNTRVGWRA